MEKEQKIINNLCNKIKDLFCSLQPEEQNMVNTLVITVDKYSKNNKDFSVFEPLISSIIGKEIRMIEDLPTDQFQVGSVHFAYFSQEAYEEELAKQNN